MFTILVEVRTGGFESALSLYQQAYSIHPSEKLMAKIKKIQVSGCVTLIDWRWMTLIDWG